MKNIFTLLAVILFAGSLSAQYYQIPFINAGQNPGGLNTDEDQTSAYMQANYTGYSEIVAPGTTDWSAAQTLPFTFNFNGTSYNSVYVAPTGIVSFTATTGAAPTSNTALPTATIPDNSICAWGVNLSGANDAIIVKTHGSAPNRQYWITWASVSWPQGGGWAYWSIVLEETSNTIYIVDARNYVSSGSGVALTAGVQINSTTAFSVAGSPNLAATNAATGGSDVGPADNSYYAFYYGTQPDYDASMSQIELPNYAKIGGTPVSVKAKVTNLGAQNITDLELTYTVGGGSPVVSSVSGLNIPSGGTAIVTHPTTWAPTTEGTFTIEYWASKINGNNDSNTANDKTSGSVTTYTNSYPRVVLFETFTSSTCAPCTPGNANFESVISGIPSSDYASVKYQMSWPGAGDPYNTADGNARRTYYGVNSVPNLEIDGGWAGNSNSFTINEYDAAAEVPAFVQIDAEYSVQVDEKKVRTCATINAMQDMGSATLQIAIIEGKTTQNVESNGETEFYHVLKKMVPNANGQSVTITDGMNQTICEDYIFQGNYRLPNNASDLINDATEHSVEEFTDLQVVVWLENNKVVYNAANAVEGITSVNSIDNSLSNVKLYPNPAVNNTTLEISAEQAGPLAIRIYDMTGRSIQQLNQSVSVGTNVINLNTQKLSNGVYFVEVSSNNNTTTERLVIQK